MTQRVAIVGSGFLGMTLALRLAESGADVTLFERGAEIGGLASAWQIGDIVWDKHYHVTLASDSYTRKLVEELGLGDEYRWVETKTGFYTDGELHSMSNSMEFLRFRPLSLLAKFRLGATIFYASRLKDWESLEKMSVERWLTRLSGKSTFEKIWRPLLKAKLGEAYKKTSAAFIWATIQRMYAARRSGLKKEMFGYVRGGYARVLKRFEEVLIEKGVEIRLDTNIDRIQRTEDGRSRIIHKRLRRSRNRTGTFQASPNGTLTKYANMQTAVTVAPGFSGMFLAEPGINAPPVAIADRKADIFDKVILTCPSNTAAQLLPELQADEKRKLEAIEYQGIVCASILTKCSLSPFYVTNLTDRAPFTGVIEMSALVDKSEFGRNALIYLPKYAGADDEIFDRSDSEIRTTFLEAMERMYPRFKRNDVLAFNISRVRQVFPLPILNYSESVPSSKTSLPGIFVINSTHITNGTLNVNETVQLAENFFRDHLST